MFRQSVYEAVKLMRRVDFDEIDIRILRMLQRDARTPFTYIAEQCNTSTDAIIRRFNKMKKKGIIAGSTILLDPKSLGYEHIASFSVDVQYPQMDDVIKSIQEIPEIIHCVPTIGRYRLFSIGFFKDFTRLSEVRDLIKSHPHVANLSANIWIGKVLLCPENFDLKLKE